MKVYDKNFLCTKSLEFSEFLKILDARMKELLQMGYGTKVNQAKAILPEDEEVLWEKDVYGNSNAEALQCTVFFYLCKLFDLMRHDEHHQLQCDQFSIGKDQGGTYVEFFGRSTKTYKGGLKELEIAKTFVITVRMTSGMWPISLDSTSRHWGDKEHFTDGPFIRYGEQPIGINKMKNFMKIICERGGLNGNYTNHSGKRSCATQLYMARVDEQEIMARTGHRSEKGCVSKSSLSQVSIKR